MSSKVVHKQTHIDIKDISPKLLSQQIKINGWVRNARIQASLAFIEVYDGSTSKTIQLISEDSSHFEELNTLSIGSAISITGTVTQHPTKSDMVEIRINLIHYTSKIHDPFHNPLNAKKTSLEMLREHQDSRVKTRTFNAVFRIRAGLSKATHDYFHSKGYHHLNPNIITTSDCEGGGEVFTITTMLDKSTASIPIKTESINAIDYRKDFFEKQAFLTVSSQLQLELLCAGLGKVWTSNKSFRSEKSRTTRHLAEFEHIEWETAWTDLYGLMDMSEEYTQYAFNYVLTKHIDDLEELNKFTSKGIIDKLQSFINVPYIRISYDDAIKIIEENATAIKSLYKLQTLPQWGDDLGTECEKYLADQVYKQPLFVYNYPKSLKSFYMKANPDNRTVQGCDLLIPGLGELIGSSVREHDYDKLMTVVQERNMDPTPLKWYLELRRNGSTPTAGAGLGFDRLVRICTGMENIRDAVPFPVAYQECKF
jgi:asparaginyl-tRNA synthetase